MYYIQEADKPKLLFEIFNHIELEENKIILPINSNEKITSRKAEILIQKTNKILDKTMCKRIVVSKKIQKQENFMNLLHTYNDLKIMDGKWLFEVLCIKILDYLISKKQLRKEETKISILVNDLSSNMLESIKQIAKDYKRVNIVTNHIEKFKKIEKQMLEQDGTMITVGNNKKKGIAKSNIILNVDFPSELVNKYNIYEKAYIINLKGNVKIEKKRFEGININDYDIKFKNSDKIDYEKQERYKNAEIYEAQINKKQTLKDILRQLEKDEVEVTKLIANHIVL